MNKPFYDPRKEVTITKSDKRGDHHTVEGIVDGKKVSVHIPEPSMAQFKTRAEGEAFMRRSLLGTKRAEDRGDHR